MDRALEVYKTWISNESEWTKWAKPIIFMNLKTAEAKSINLPEVSWIGGVNPQSTALIIDLPGKSSLLEGLTLANAGFRPVPLYNSACAPRNYKTLVDVGDIVSLLESGGAFLQNLNSASSASPVFLLDSNRMALGSVNKSGLKPGTFDNRWQIVPADMPSADYLCKQGINKIIVRFNSRNIAEDLTHILLRYQEKGIEIFSCTTDKVVVPAHFHRPSFFKSIFYRWKTFRALSRNSAGGFGGAIHESSGRAG